MTDTEPYDPPRWSVDFEYDPPHLITPSADRYMDRGDFDISDEEYEALVRAGAPIGCSRPEGHSGRHFCIEVGYWDEGAVPAETMGDSPEPADPGAALARMLLDRVEDE